MNNNTEKNDNMLRIKIKVTNTVDGRIDFHENLTKEDIEWIKCNPNLHVEVLEVGRNKYSK